MKTYSQKTSEIKREWYIVDASTLPLGKLAVVIADKLMGKSKVTYTPHTDNGDYVIVVNAKELKATGNKMNKVQTLKISIPTTLIPPNKLYPRIFFRYASRAASTSLNVVVIYQSYHNKRENRPN